MQSETSSNAFQRNVAALMGTLCVVLILLVASLQWHYIQYERSLLVATEQRNARISFASQYLSILQDVESGQRGYVLTGDAAFLTPLYSTEQTRKVLEQGLSKAYAPGSQQSAIANSLLHVGNEKLQFARQVVTARRLKNAEAAIGMIAEGTGIRLMTRARDLLAALVSQERDQEELALQAANARRERQRVSLLVAEGALICAALALMFALLEKVRELRAKGTSLANALETQSAILESANDAMLILSSDGTILSVNTAAEALFGRKRCDLIGLSNLVLFTDPPSPGASAAYLQRLATGDIASERTMTFIGRRGGGSSFEIEVVTTPVLAESGLQFLAVGRDVTERRRVERLKTEFVATVSHELRTPLTSIAGSLGLLAGGVGGALPSKAKRLIDIALSNSQRLIRLINDILDVEKIESGKMIFDRRPLVLSELLNKLAQANSGFALKHEVRVDIAQLPAEAIVIADEDRMLQVLTNLLSNAIKFSPKGETVLLSAAKAGKYWRVTVADKGPGIPDEFKSRMYDKFTQADASDAKILGGSGLGLSIAKEIITRSGGRIFFDSAPDLGTTFHVEIPAKEDNQATGESY